MTHVTIKAAAAAVLEMPALNGRLLFGEYHRTRDVGVVDVSVGVDISDAESVVLKVTDAGVKPVEYLADEMQTTSKALRAARKAGIPSLREKASQFLPPYLSNLLETIMSMLSSQLGVTFPALGLVGFPLGAVTVITCPNKEGETDIDIAMIPTIDSSSSTAGVSAASAPITITIGGIRVLPSLDLERKVSATPVLNVAIAVDSRAASLMEVRRFCSKVQQFMNNPVLTESKNERRLRDEAAMIKSKSSAGKQNKSKH